MLRLTFAVFSMRCRVNNPDYQVLNDQQPHKLILLRLRHMANCMPEAYNCATVRVLCGFQLANQLLNVFMRSKFAFVNFGKVSKTVVSSISKWIRKMYGATF